MIMMGIPSCNLLVVIPGSSAMALQIARYGTVGVAPHHVPCTSQMDVQNPLACKTKKVKSTHTHTHTHTHHDGDEAGSSLS